MYFPTWIDLKGQDAVPETVHHVVSLPSIYLSSLLYILFQMKFILVEYQQGVYIN